MKVISLKQAKVKRANCLFFISETNYRNSAQDLL